MSGVFAVDRGIFDHPFFAPEPYTEREAWLWLIGAAAWKPKRVRAGRSVYQLDRGQLSFSERFLAVKFKWSKSRVHRFLKRLEIESMVILLADHETNLITICNYDKYAFNRTTTVSEIEPPNGPEADQKRTKEEELNKVEEKKERKKEGDALRAPPPDQSSLESQATDEAIAVADYNHIANQNRWPRVEKLTPPRRRALLARLSENEGLTGFRAMLARAGRSDFLTGKIPRGAGHENWMPNFDWFVTPKNFLKIMEGSYDNRSGGKTTSFGQQSSSAKGSGAAFLAGMAGFHSRDDCGNSGQGSVFTGPTLDLDATDLAGKPSCSDPPKLVFAAK